jgi:LacI family transcriptional regulator
MKRSARMSDVAKLAGVSTMTVSRVLNESTNVTESMRVRVFSAIEQLRYQPNELARSLREQRTRQIGVIVPYLFDPFFALCANEVSHVAKQHAYSVVLATSNEDAQAEFDEANRMLRRNVEGLIVIPARMEGTPSLLLADDFHRLPIVTIDRPIHGSRFDSFLVENERGAQIGTRHLIALGHKRIAYIGLTDRLFTMDMRHRGYTKAMERDRLQPVYVLLSGERENAREHIRSLLAQKSPPTAFFCANNLVTRQVLHALQDLGIHPPEKVALVGFDDFETADLLRPGITVVRQPAEELSRAAAEMLFDRLSDGGRKLAARTIVLPVDLIVRGSCGAQIGAR